jgi:hypothetical protein
MRETIEGDQSETKYAGQHAEHTCDRNEVGLRTGSRPWDHTHSRSQPRDLRFKVVVHSTPYNSIWDYTLHVINDSVAVDGATAWQRVPDLQHSLSKVCSFGHTTKSFNKVEI